jgi:hypothetical protein
MQGDAWPLLDELGDNVNENELESFFFVFELKQLFD